MSRGNPNDRVTVRFNIDPDGSGTQALTEKDRLIQQIAASLGTASDRLRGLLGGINPATANISILQQIRDNLTGINQAAQGTNLRPVLDQLLQLGGEIKSEDKLIQDLRAEFQALGVSLPTNQLREMGGTGRAELKGLLDEARLFRSEITAASAAGKGLSNLPGSGTTLLGKFDPTQISSVATLRDELIKAGGELRSESRLVQDLRVEFGKLGVDLPTNLLQQFGVTGRYELKQLLEQTRLLTSQLDAAGAVLRGVTNIAPRIPPTRGQAPLVGNFDIRPGDQRPTKDTRQVDQELITRFNAAAKAGEDGYGRIATATDKATKRGAVFSGTTYVGTQILRTFGIEGSRAIEVIARQVLDFGLTFEDIINNKLIRFTLAFAAVVGVGEIVQNLTGSIRKLNEELAKSAENRVRVTGAGLSGTLGEVQSDLKKLEEFSRDIQFFRSKNDFNRADQLARRALGGRGSEEQVNEAQRAFAAEQRSSSFFSDFLTLGYSKLARIQEARSKLTHLEGGAITPEQLDARIKDAGRDVIEFQKSLVGTGQKNIFDEASDSLNKLTRSIDREARNLARGIGAEGRNTNIQQVLLTQFKPGRNDISAFINGLQGQSLTPDQIEAQIKRFQRGLELDRDFLNSVQALEHDITSEFQREERKFKEADQVKKNLQDIRIELADNPLEKAYAKAIERVEQFNEKLKNGTELQRQQAKELRDELNDLTIFKEIVNSGQKFQGLREEVQRIQAGSQPNALDIANKERETLAEGRIRDARRSGDVNALRVAQGAFIDRQSELEEQLRQARQGGQFTRAAEIENQLAALNRDLSDQRLNRDIRSQELDILKNQLAGARGIPQQTFLLDRILDATSKTNELNQDQRDFRLKALQQRLSIGEAERHRVLIEIKNGVPGVSTTVDQELGPNSGSTSLPLVSGGASSPFAGPFDPQGGSF